MSLIWLAVGNAVYYVTAILLAALIKDNRAFCKYICPIPTVQKIGPFYVFDYLQGVISLNFIHALPSQVNPLTIYRCYSPIIVTWIVRLRALT